MARWIRATSQLRIYGLCGLAPLGAAAASDGANAQLSRCWLEPPTLEPQTRRFGLFPIPLYSRVRIRSDAWSMASPWHTQALVERLSAALSTNRTLTSLDLWRSSLNAGAARLRLPLLLHASARLGSADQYRIPPRHATCDGRATAVRRPCDARRMHTAWLCGPTCCTAAHHGASPPCVAP